jgi:hypothetical protein
MTRASTAIAKFNRDSIAGFAATIRRGTDRGEIRGGVDATAQASLIVASLRGVMTQWLLDPKHTDLDAIEREFRFNLQRSPRP